MHEHEQTQQGGRPARLQEKAAPSLASQTGNAGIARLVEGEGIDRSGGGGGAERLDREIARAIDEQRGAAANSTPTRAHARERSR